MRARVTYPGYIVPTGCVKLMEVELMEVDMKPL